MLCGLIYGSRQIFRWIRSWRSLGYIRELHNSYTNIDDNMCFNLLFSSGPRGVIPNHCGGDSIWGSTTYSRTTRTMVGLRYPLRGRRRGPRRFGRVQTSRFQTSKYQAQICVILYNNMRVVSTYMHREAAGKRIGALPDRKRLGRFQTVWQHGFTVQSIEGSQRLIVLLMFFLRDLLVRYFEFEPLVHSQYDQVAFDRKCDVFK